MVSFDLILVIVVIIFILASLYWNILGPALTFMVGIITLGVFGVLTPGEILKGFSNEQVAVVILFLLISDLIRKTGAVEGIFDRYFRYAKSYKGFLGRMMLLISGFSTFINDTPLVALMMPYVHTWCKKNNYPPSKFLIPLSYAAILGGCATLVGTSTNLIVGGLVAEQNIAPDLKPLQIFDFTPVGLPMIFVGFLYMMFLGHKFLPSHPDVITQFSTGGREYLFETRIPDKSVLIGKTIDGAGLSNIAGADLVELWRRGTKITDFDSEFILKKEDILLFAGDNESIAYMADGKHGLTLPEVGMLARKKRSEIVEVVVSQNSTLINKTLREAGFRGKYDAAVISVHRNGELLKNRPGEIKLKAGDVLLLFAGVDFGQRTYASTDFYFISKIREFVKVEWYKNAVLLGGILIAILLSAFKLFPLVMSLVITVLLALALKVTKPKEIVTSIDFNLAIIIILSLALGTAMIKSGAAELVAHGIISLFLPLGRFALLTGIFLITSILAAFITAKAAAAIIFPISLATAVNLGLNPLPFVLIVSFGAAANFMTPIGFQTNLMVYGPGGYNFRDFFRTGTPLTVLYMITAVTILYFLYLL
jgi:di/tricarboxylate transporter